MGEQDSEDRLMERATAGDASAFDLIVRRHQHRLQRFATRMLGGDASQGADVAVGAFLRLWETRRSYQPCGQLEAWLLRTAYRLCLDVLVRAGRTQSIDSLDPVAEGFVDLVEQYALAEAVRAAVLDLPDAHRAVLVLSVYEDMTYEEISEALRVPTGTVASRKNHAIAMLRRRMAGWEEPR